MSASRADLSSSLRSDPPLSTPLDDPDLDGWLEGEPTAGDEPFEPFTFDDEEIEAALYRRQLEMMP